MKRYEKIVNKPSMIFVNCCVHSTVTVKVLMGNFGCYMLSLFLYVFLKLLV